MSEPKRYPISEIFGPTLQGEGPLAGRKTLFIRFAGCDYDCGATGGSFICDTRYAVKPKYPGWKRRMMTADEILGELEIISSPTQNTWITLSGGNPALFFDENLAYALATKEYRLAMETQGSVLMTEQTLSYIRLLVISPKPPSSGMSSRTSLETLSTLILRASLVGNVVLKFVVFDDRDLEWVHETVTDLTLRVRRRLDLYLSAGSPVNHDLSLPALRDSILSRYQWLWGKISSDPRFANYVGLPQLHTLVFGQVKGI